MVWYDLDCCYNKYKIIDLQIVLLRLSGTTFSDIRITVEPLLKDTPVIKGT